MEAPLDNSEITGNPEVIVGQKSAWGKYDSITHVTEPKVREVRLWIVSVRPTTRPESAKAGSDYFPGEF